MAVLPTLTVEIAFGQSPLADIRAMGSPTWTDVSAYVRSGSIRRGRSNELESFSTGTCSIVLSNGDRRFDPTHTTGPHFGTIVPRCPIRVSATYNATTYQLFYGFVAAWPQDRPVDSKDLTVTIQAVDGMAYLSTAKLQDDWYTTYVMSFSPTAVWTLGDEGTTQQDLVSQKNFTLTTDLDHSAASCATFITKNPTTFDTINSGLNANVVQTGAFTMLAWFRCEVGFASRPILATAGTTRIGVDGFGLPHYFTGGAAGVYGNQFVNTGDNFMIAVTHDATSAMIAPALYVNGQDKSAGATAGATGTATWIALAASTVAGEAPFSGPIQHVALIPSVLTYIQIYALYVAAVNALQGANTATQVSNVLDVVGWPASWRSLTTQSGRLLDAIETSNNSALDVINKMTTSEQGLFYISKSGDAVLFGIWDLYDTVNHPRSGSSQFTFSDAGTAGTVGYADAGYDLDDSFLANEVIVKTAQNQSAYVKNDASIALYGKRSISIDTRLQTIAEAQQLANARIARYAVPSARLRTFTVYPQADPTTAYPKMLGLEIADRVTMRAQPTGSGSITNADYWIEGIEHSFDATSWTCHVNASAVPGGSYWTLGTSAMDGTSTRLS
jgi:hypothetical protein